MSQIEQFKLEPGIEYIKIHGLQRTGTNYMAYLLDQNLEKTKTIINAGGWKHGYYCAPWSLGREVNLVVLKKDPYSWLVSMYNYWGPNKTQPVGPDLSNVDFDSFVRGRAIFEEKAGSPFLYLAANPIQHWNNMYFHWSSIKMNEKKMAIIPYEVLLQNTQYVVEAIAKHFGINRKSEPFIDAHSVVLPANEESIVSDSPFKRDHYIKKEYLSYFNQSLIEFINKELDEEVMMMLGYDKIQP